MKKALSLFIVFCLVFSLFPTVDASGPETDVQLVGKYSQEEYKDRKTYTVTVPAVLGPGQSSSVIVSGGVPGGYSLYVSAADSVTLSYNSQTITLDVYFEPLLVVGSDLDEVSASGKVALEDKQVAFGTWTGNFSYSVSLIENGETPEPVVNTEDEDFAEDEITPPDNQNEASPEEKDNKTPIPEESQEEQPVVDEEVTPQPEEQEDFEESDEESPPPTVQIATIDASDIGKSNINIPFVVGMTWNNWLTSYYSANVLNEDGDNITIKYDENAGYFYVEEYDNARIYISADSFNISDSVISANTTYKLVIIES